VAAVTSAVVLNEFIVTKSISQTCFMQSRPIKGCGQITYETETDAAAAQPPQLDKLLYR